MKAMATDMGDTIATQNDQIDRMNVKAESNSNRIKAANERAQNILDSWITDRVLFSIVYLYVSLI